MPEQRPGWYPDPTRRHQHRYWDGRGWTEHVGSNGVASTDPMAPEPQVDDRLEPDQVRGILADAGVRPSGAGGGTLFDEPVLVLYQRVTGTGDALGYTYVDQSGAVVGRCHELATEQLDAAEASFGELMDDANTDRFAFVDPAGAPWARLTHKKVWKSTITLTDATGQEIGALQQQNVLGKVRLGLAAGGHELGRIVSDDTQLLGFTITDAGRNRVGRVTKLGRYSQPGFFGPSKVLGCYVLQLDQRPARRLHALALAAPLAVDLAFSVTQAGHRSLRRQVSGD